MRLFFVKYWPIYLLLALSVLGQSFVVLQSKDFLVSSILPDDAFYYLQIAKNISVGNNSTFDGVNLTNGYHPLWMVINVAVFSILGQSVVDPMLPIRVLLFISVALNFLTAFIVFLILRCFTDQRWLWVLGLFLWLFNPFVVAESLNGLETSLSLFFISLVFYLFLRFKEKNVSVWLGVCSGLMILARLDNVFYFLVLFLWLGFEAYQTKKYRQWLVVGMLATLVAMPWFVWNYFTFGMFSTSAANTASLVTHQLVYQDNTATWWLWPKTVLYMTNLDARQVLNQTGAPEVMLFLVGLLLGVLLMGGYLKKVDWKNPSPLAVLFCGWVVMFLANSSWRWVGRSWYFIAFNLFLIYLLIWMKDKIKDKINFNRIFLLPVFLLILFFFALGWKRDIVGSHAPQLTMLEASRWEDENLPDGSVIGVFNAGVQGYFSKHRVVNLDGLVNNKASEAIVGRRLGAYIVDNVDYVSDFQIYLNYRYKGFMGDVDIDSKIELLEQVGSGVELYGDDSGISIYKIKS